MQRTTIASADGTRLSLVRWPPPPSPRGRVLLVHGLAEHMGRYPHVASALTQASWEVAGIELRGHGDSEGPRGHVEAWSDYVADVQAAIRAVGGPLYLVAHSMGGLVTLDLLRSRGATEEVLGLVTTSPLLGLAFTPPRIKTAASRLLSAVLPRLSLGNELDVNHISRDPEVVRRYQEDPKVFSTITPRWFTEMLAAQARVRAAAATYVTPLLLLLGEADAITSPQAAAEFFEAYGAPEKDCVRYPSLYHELFNEPEKAEVLAEVVRWLDRSASHTPLA